MEVVKMPLCNLHLVPPPGMEDNVYAMHAWTDGKRIVSWWKPTMEEIEQLRQGGHIVLSVVGYRQPPIAVLVEPPQ